MISYISLRPSVRTDAFGRKLGTKVSKLFGTVSQIRISQPGTAEPNMQQSHRIGHRSHPGASPPPSHLHER